MKKMYKAMLLVLCAVMLVVASVMGTLAYLQMTTGTVQNTFTVGKVEITLDEAKVNEYGEKNGTNRIEVAADVTGGNKYKLIPGHTYVKDPTVTVKAGSEACYVFVKVVNGISDIEAGTSITSQITANGWTALTDVVYYQLIDSSDDDQKLNVFSNFTIKTDANVSAYGSAKIEITAYAIQLDGFADTAKTELENAQAAWTAGNFS